MTTAVLADDDPHWRPDEFQNRLFDCKAGIRFKPVKLLDFAAHEVMLEESTNPFAKVVLAHLKARQTHDDPVNRYAWTTRLVRGRYERGFSAKDVRDAPLPPSSASLATRPARSLRSEHLPDGVGHARIRRTADRCMGLQPNSPLPAAAGKR